MCARIQEHSSVFQAGEDIISIALRPSLGHRFEWQILREKPMSPYTS